jgi:hypothetical protein
MSKGPIGFSKRDDEITEDNRWVEEDTIIPKYVQDVHPYEDEISEGYAEDY